MIVHSLKCKCGLCCKVLLKSGSKVYAFQGITPGSEAKLFIDTQHGPRPATEDECKTLLKKRCKTCI